MPLDGICGDDDDDGHDDDDDGYDVDDDDDADDDDGYDDDDGGDMISTFSSQPLFITIIIIIIIIAIGVGPSLGVSSGMFLNYFESFRRIFVRTSQLLIHPHSLTHPLTFILTPPNSSCILSSSILTPLSYSSLLLTPTPCFLTSPFRAFKMFRHAKCQPPLNVQHMSASSPPEGR